MTLEFEAFPKIPRLNRGMVITEKIDGTNACVAFSDDGKPIASSLMMRRALEYAKAFGFLILSHAEDVELCSGGAAHEGWTALKMGLPGIPSAAEEVAIARDILLARQTGGRRG